MEHLQYPVGKHLYNADTIHSRKQDCIHTIATYYHNIRDLSDMLSDHQKLQATYRPGGWTAGQVIHHVADSHMHALLRFKMTLTEMDPIVKPYDEGFTALLSDYKSSIEIPLMILQGVHNKWTHLLNEMTDEEYDRVYIHPQYGKRFTLWEALSLYDWHCRHHLGHLKLCLTR